MPSSNVADRLVRRRFSTSDLIWVGTLLASLWLISQGKLELLALVVVAFLAVAISRRWPMLAILLLIVLSTNNFEFVSMDNLPYWQLAEGLRLNVRDLLLIMLFVLAVYQLAQRRERPIFLVPMLLMGVVVVITSVIGFTAGTTDLHSWANTLRIIAAYLFYFILIGNVSSPNRLHTLIRVLFFIMVLSVVVQLGEASTGYRLTVGGGLSSSEFFNTTKQIAVQEQEVPYLWNRATFYLFTALFLALGCVFQGQRIKLYLPLALLAFLGFAIALARSWYLYVAIGIVTLIVLNLRNHRIRYTLVGTALVILVFLVAMSTLGPFIGTTYRGSLLGVWTERVQSLFQYQQQASFISRVATSQLQLAYITRSPIFGYGLGQEWLDLQNSDTGILNTLLAFGLIGLAAILPMIISVFLQGNRLLKRLPSSVEKSYVYGLMGLWVGVLVGYGFSMDFFTRIDGIWMVALVMGILDRVAAFETRGILAIQGKTL